MRAISLLLAASLVACAPGDDRADTAMADTSAGATASDSQPQPSTRIELRTDSTRYAPGAKVTLTLVNKADATYAFNPCTRIVMRETGGRWENVDEPQRMCTMEAWLLEPNATRSGDTELPGSLEAGQYRIAVSLSREGQTPPAEHELAMSAPFTVGR